MHCQKDEKSWKRRYLTQTWNPLRKIWCQRSSIRIQNQPLHRWTKMTTLNPTNLAKGTTLVLFAVKDAMERQETFASINQVAQIRQVTLPLEIRLPLDTHLAEQCPNPEKTELKGNVQWAIAFAALWTGTTMAWLKMRIGMTTMSQRPSLSGQTDYKYIWRWIFYTHWLNIINIILINVQIFGDINSIHEHTTMRLLHAFIKHLVAATLDSWFALSSKSHKTTQWGAVDQLQRSNQRPSGILRHK